MTLGWDEANPVIGWARLTPTLIEAAQLTPAGWPLGAPRESQDRICD